MDSPPGERKQDSGEADAQDLRAQVLIETLQELKLQDKKDVDCCVICLEAITERCELNPCGHSNFDYNCLLNWLLEKQKCPLCKADAVEVYHGPADDRITSPIKLTRKRKPATSPSRSHLPSSLFLSRDETLFKAAIERRAMVYAHRRFSKHIGTNSISRFRELTPVMFNSDPALVSRARMWMRRELHVFPFLSRNDEPPSSSPAAALGRPQPHHHHGRGNIVRLREHNAEYLLEFIVAVLKTVDIRGSAGQAEDMLADYLGRDNAQLFLHELASWLRSPCDRLEDWDRMVHTTRHADLDPFRPKICPLLDFGPGRVE
ncbi:putative RING finger protein [Escovopsis weberi]|uniref:RING-type E3 ubiquitin transferase n=1 Tax=Escovopsis weberi TaxID=150374 RepID=A0A0M8MR34_ESCWE|nr:putative RING finger protein [Escovopsis weberi]